MARYPKGSGYIDFVGAEEHYWRNETLWAAAAREVVEEVALDDLPWKQDGCYVLGDPPTWGAMAEHVKRTVEADLAHPVIIGPSGDIIDGMHRIMRAHVQGLPTIGCVRLRAMPPPDEVHPRV